MVISLSRDTVLLFDQNEFLSSKKKVLQNNVACHVFSLPFYDI